MNGSMSGMDYNKIQAILDEVEGCKSKMADILGNLITNIPAAVADAYSGDAAEQYKRTFTESANKINNTMTEIHAQLKKNTTQKEAEYQAQDQAMKNSTDLTGRN